MSNSGIPPNDGGRGSDSLGGARAVNQELMEHAASGLSRRPRMLSPRFLYDAKGAELFKQITQLEAYYVARTELSILQMHGASIAKWIRAGSVLFEPGAGECSKVELLLAHAPHVRGYVAQDIAGGVLRDGVARVKRRFPELDVKMIEGNFVEEFAGATPGTLDAPVCVFFPGSTIGNFEPPRVVELLARFRALSGSKGQLILGVDLLKSPDLLQRAYDDPEGVTAAFNLNLLHRLVREAGARIDVSAFGHQAIFNAEHGRIEMWLRARRSTEIELAGARFEFAEGEGICTEYSYKFAPAELSEIGKRAGFRLEHVFTDGRGWFAECAFAAR